MVHFLVVGYGNPLRGDDGFGWHVARALEAEKPDEDVQVVACHQLTPELAELLARARYAIFVDAASNLLPGKLELHQVEPRHGLVRFSHHLTPGDVLAYAQQLYGKRPRRVWLITVGAQDLDLTDTLSECAAQVVPAVLKEIRLLCGMTGEERSPADSPAVEHARPELRN